MNSSPAFYWLFNYVFDILVTVIWFCYLLLIYCIVDVAFNGSPSSRPAAVFAVEFATSWDLRVQFYPLSILIALPTLPFVYLLTKLFKSDILVSTFETQMSNMIHILLCTCLGWTDHLCDSDYYSSDQYHCPNHRGDYR